MSVSIEQNIRAFTVAAHPGTITSKVKVTNQGNQSILGSARGLGFWLQDESGNYIPGFLRLDPPVEDATAPIPGGGSFEREVHFTTGSPVDTGQQYTLACIFQQTRDHDASTFSFSPLFLETPGQAGFAS